MSNVGPHTNPHLKMTRHNPFAPPGAEVADIQVVESAPRIWNPGAAAGLSLIFSPVFGAYLHMKNWEALGQPEKAATSKNWAIVAAVFLAGATLLSVLLIDSKAIDALTRLGGFVLLISWYYASGKYQSTYVRAKFGKQYPHRGWLAPLSVAIGIFIALVAVVAVLAFALGR